MAQRQLSHGVTAQEAEELAAAVVSEIPEAIRDALRKPEVRRAKNGTYFLPINIVFVKNGVRCRISANIFLHRNTPTSSSEKPKVTIDLSQYL